MESVKDRIRALAESVGKTIATVEKELGIGNGTIGRWDASAPSADKLAAVADYFDVSVDYLLGRSDSKKGVESSLNSRDRRDIAKTLEELKEQLMNEKGLMFDGDPLSPEALESILSATQVGLELAKARNKERYTPKKYRKPQE